MKTVMKKNSIVFWAALVSFLYSCSATTFTSKYYFQHQKVLDKIQQTYKELYKQKAFSICFTDKDFRTVSLEIHTDSITYIYEMGVNEPRMKDTLLKYDLDVAGTIRLVELMRRIHCTWVNAFDYYVDEQKKLLIFISMKPVAFQPFLAKPKYYILTYYSVPQHFDDEGRLLDKKRLRRLRKINGEIFHRVNDTVCYTISGQFR